MGKWSVVHMRSWEKGVLIERGVKWEKMMVESVGVTRDV